MIENYKSTFQPGLVVNQEFLDYPAMQESATNWLFLSKYRFGTGNFYGRHDGIQLYNMQFGHAHKHEGMMLQGVSPKDCFTIVLLQKSSGKVCLNGVKMKVGDVIIIDDSKPYDFSSSDQTLMAIISIRKSLIIKYMPSFYSSIDKKFNDSKNILSDIIENEWQSILNDPEKYKKDNNLKATEQRILYTLKNALTGQTGESPCLTKGEETALDVKSFLLDSLVEDITIDNLVKEFSISYKTLENSFKSLLGITPKRFLTLLKLNHARNDLLTAESTTTNISDIAIKWGFIHFGRFSQSYKALFNELPSKTLKKPLTY